MIDDPLVESHRPLHRDLNTSNEHAFTNILTGLIVGSLAMVAWEWSSQHLLRVSTVPTSRQQRLLIVSQISLWVGLCATMTGWLFSARWFDRLTRLLPETLRGSIGPGLWCLGITLFLTQVRGTAVLWSMTAGILLFAGFRSGAVLLSRLSRDGPLPVIAAGLWTSTFVARWSQSFAGTELASGISIVLGLSMVAGVARWTRASPKIGNLFTLLTLVAVVVLELAEGDHALLFLGMIAYVAAVSLEGAADTAARARICWSAAIVATTLLPLVRSFTDGGHLASGVAAGSVVAMLLHASFPQGLTQAGSRAFEAASGPLGFLVSVGAILISPVASAAILGSGLGLWDRLFIDSTKGLDPPAGRYHTRDAWIVGFLMAMAVIARIVFWLVTDRVWEDALITIRHAENAIAGNGLTHHPAHGLVHGFTSPVSVLVPLLGEWIRPGGGLVALRLASLLAGAMTVWFAGKVASHPDINLSTPSLIFWLSYYAFEHSQISFGMAGMETQIWTCVLVGGVAALLYGRLLWLALALSLAALCRPEAVLWIGCASAAWLWQQGWRRLFSLAGLVSLGIAPWLCFTTWYYGSPVPNTIRAKSAGYLYNTQVGIRFPSFLNYVIAELGDQMGNVMSLLPPHFVGHGFALIGTFPAPGLVIALLVWLGSMGSIALIRLKSWFIPPLIGAMLAYFALVVRIIFPWYPPPILGLAALLVASGIDVSCRVFQDDRIRVTGWILGIGLTTIFMVTLPATYASEGLVQHLVEDRVRARVGLWLRDHAGPDDYVTAECLGYLGYYSHLPFHDYPGLSSPRAVAALNTTRGEDRFLSPIVEILRPTWLVLRERELASAPADYELMHRIGLGAAEKKALSRYLPIQTFDDEFSIYRRKSRRRKRLGPVRRSDENRNAPPRSGDQPARTDTRSASRVRIRAGVVRMPS